MDQDDARGTPQLVAEAGRLYAPAPWVVPAAGACLAAGVIAFIVGLLVAPARAWGAFVANWLYWTGIALCGAAIVATMNVSGAGWGKTIERVAAGLVSFLPVSLLGPVVLAAGTPYLFSPMGATHRHPVWFTPWVLLLRDWVVLAAMALFFLWYVYRAARPDMAALPEDARRQGLAAWMARGWRGDAQERQRSYQARHTWAPAVILAYAFGYSLLAVDLGMSFVPNFHSTMYPGIYFIGSFYAALAVTAVLVACWRPRVPAIEGIVGPGYARDLGNLTWAFAILWTYVTWAQYYVIWYGNLPDEAIYVALRYRTLPWQGISWLALIATFIIPFVMLFARGIKRHPLWLAYIAAVGAVGILLQRLMDVLPFVSPPAAGTFGLVEAGVSVGFVGLVALCYVWLMRRVPLFPAADPHFVRAVAVRNVEV